MQGRPKLILDNVNTPLELHPHEYWYLAPCRTTFECGEIVRPLDFTFVLHNAKLAQGVAIALDDLLLGIASTPLRSGPTKDAELLLEKVRVEHFPDKPSRLRSYFLNQNRHVAELRQNTMFRGSRKLVRCQVVLNSGKFHHGDVDIFERLTGRPDDINLAMSYWLNFNPATEAEIERLEVIADSALYFPDWKDFPLLAPDVLIAWQESIISAQAAQQPSIQKSPAD